jgi:NADH-quinone oxidoreductase subunit B
MTQAETTYTDRQPAKFPGLVHETPGGGILSGPLEDVVNWARSNSLWPLTFATSCCGIEMMSTAAAKYDFARFGFEVARATPRQADVIIIAGTIVNKMAPVLKRLYDQMADPKYVIAMGACAISGGPFFYNTYSVVKGADHVIPVAPSRGPAARPHHPAGEDPQRDSRTDRHRRKKPLRSKP